jgi:hypothetical protein
MTEKPMGERVATLETEFRFTLEAVRELVLEVKGLREVVQAQRETQSGWRGSFAAVMQIMQTIAIPAGFLWLGHILGK